MRRSRRTILFVSRFQAAFRAFGYLFILREPNAILFSKKSRIPAEIRWGRPWIEALAIAEEADQGGGLGRGLGRGVRPTVNPTAKSKEQRMYRRKIFLRV